MINQNYLCIYDLETTGLDANAVYPVEIAAVIVHPRKLTLVEGATFWSFCCPPDVDKIPHDLWEFHAKANKCTVTEIKEKIYAAPPLESVFKDFANFLAAYHADGSTRKSKFSAPILCGMNIERYDNVIFNRCCKEFGFCDKNGEQKIVHPRDCIDLLRICTLFFSNQAEPAKYNFDCLREYFGLPSDGGHTAILDVQQTAEVITRFLRYFWDIAARTNFKNSCAATNKGKE